MGISLWLNFSPIKSIKWPSFCFNLQIWKIIPLLDQSGVYETRVLVCNRGKSKLAFPVSFSWVFQYLSYIFCHLWHSYKEKGKLNFSKLSVYSMSFLLRNRKGQSLFVRGKTVSQTLENFFASSDEEIWEEHTPIWYKNTHGERKLVSPEEKKVSIWDKQDLGCEIPKGLWLFLRVHGYLCFSCYELTVKMFLSSCGDESSRTEVCLFSVFAQLVSREEFIALSSWCRCFFPAKRREKTLQIFISAPEWRCDITYKANKPFLVVKPKNSHLKNKQQRWKGSADIANNAGWGCAENQLFCSVVIAYDQIQSS